MGVHAGDPPAISRRILPTTVKKGCMLAIEFLPNGVAVLCTVIS